MKKDEKKKIKLEMKLMGLFIICMIIFSVVYLSAVYVIVNNSEARISKVLSDNTDHMVKLINDMLETEDK